jgi:hypothetical protein
VGREFDVGTELESCADHTDFAESFGCNEPISGVVEPLSAAVALQNTGRHQPPHKELRPIVRLSA